MRTLMRVMICLGVIVLAWTLGGLRVGRRCEATNGAAQALGNDDGKPIATAQQGRKGEYANQFRVVTGRMWSQGQKVYLDGADMESGMKSGIRKGDFVFRVHDGGMTRSAIAVVVVLKNKEVECTWLGRPMPNIFTDPGLCAIVVPHSGWAVPVSAKDAADPLFSELGVDSRAIPWVASPTRKNLLRCLFEEESRMRALMLHHTAKVKYRSLFRDKGVVNQVMNCMRNRTPLESKRFREVRSVAAYALSIHTNHRWVSANGWLAKKEKMKDKFADWVINEMKKAAGSQTEQGRGK